VGAVARAHGLTGAVKLKTFDAQAPSLRPGLVLHVTPPGGAAPLDLVVATLRRTPDALLVTFEPPLTRDQAESLRGAAVHVDRTAFPTLEPGEVWACDLPGFTVRGVDGLDLGTVERLEAGAAHDVLLVRTPQGLVPVPFVAAMVKHVDPEGRCVEVDLPDGFLGDPDLRG
jgi:16S rRNA processing protein RimM